MRERLKTRLRKIGLWNCRKLAWHPQRYREALAFTGISHARCGRCGFEGLVDSQGNLF